MQSMLALCLAPVDAGFDLDGLAQDVAVPRPGTVPSGYLCIPRKLCERLAEVGCHAFIMWYY
jgi:hypothetical protein